MLPLFFDLLYQTIYQFLMNLFHSDFLGAAAQKLAALPLKRVLNRAQPSLENFDSSVSYKLSLRIYTLFSFQSRYHSNFSGHSLVIVKKLISDILGYNCNMVGGIVIYPFSSHLNINLSFTIHYMSQNLHKSFLSIIGTIICFLFLDAARCTLASCLFLHGECEFSMFHCWYVLYRNFLFPLCQITY